MSGVRMESDPRRGGGDSELVLRCETREDTELEADRDYAEIVEHLMGTRMHFIIIN